MADNSAIEWTDATWNPIRARNKQTGKVGWHCEHATTGCEFCYAEGFNKRLGTGLSFKPGHRKDIELFLDEEMLLQPLRWKKPRRIFVCSTTDLFAEFVSDEMLGRIFAVMGACDDQGLGHEFQVLTKRAQRQRKWVSQSGFKAWNSRRLATEAWPARNVWFGVSAERQQEANERIPLLLQTPAAVRFISAEPLLGPIRLGSIWWDEKRRWLDALSGKSENCGGRGPNVGKIDWLIVGGESGPNARPMHPDWVRSLRDQCASAGVAFFFKQWGEWAPGNWEDDGDFANFTPLDRSIEVPDLSDHVRWQDRVHWFAIAPEGLGALRLSKAKAGRLLDGVEHNGMPAVSA